VSLQLQLDRVEALEHHLQAQNAQRLSTLVQVCAQLSECVRLSRRWSRSTKARW
jgi:hypothetical protein